MENVRYNHHAHAQTTLTWLLKLTQGSDIYCTFLSGLPCMHRKERQPQVWATYRNCCWCSWHWNCHKLVPEITFHEAGCSVKTSHIVRAVQTYVKKLMLRICDGQGFVSGQEDFQDLMNAWCLLEGEKCCWKSACLNKAQEVFQTFNQENVCNLTTEKVLSSMQFSGVRWKMRSFL